MGFYFGVLGGVLFFGGGFGWFFFGFFLTSVGFVTDCSYSILISRKYNHGIYTAVSCIWSMEHLRSFAVMAIRVLLSPPVLYTFSSVNAPSSISLCL